MFRFLGSFLTACLVVAVMVIIAVGLWGGFSGGDDAEIEPEAHPLELLVGYDSLDVAELMGEPRRRLPELEPPPPDLPPAVSAERRDVRGFVQLELEVDAGGAVTGARVLDAAPAGVFESEALAIARRQVFPAGEPGTRIRIIDFAVPGDRDR